MLNLPYRFDGTRSVKKFFTWKDFPRVCLCVCARTRISVMDFWGKWVDNWIISYLRGIALMGLHSHALKLFGNWRRVEWFQFQTRLTLETFQSRPICIGPRKCQFPIESYSNATMIIHSSSPPPDLNNFEGRKLITAKQWRWRTAHSISYSETNPQTKVPKTGLCFIIIA